MRIATELTKTLIALALAGGCLGCGSSQGGAETPSEAPSAEPEEATPMQWYEHHMTQAGSALAQGDQAGALESYLSAARALDDTGEVTIKRGEAHYLAADLAYQRMEKELAVEEYQKAVDIYLRFTGNSRIKAAVALTNMGVIYKEMVEKSKARNCWEQALQLYKNAPPELQQRANMQKIEQNIRDLDEGF